MPRVTLRASRAAMAALAPLDLPAAPASPQPASLTLAEVRRDGNRTVRLTQEEHGGRPYLRLTVAAENQAERTVSLRVQEGRGAHLGTCHGHVPGPPRRRLLTAASAPQPPSLPPAPVAASLRARQGPFR